MKIKEMLKQIEEICDKLEQGSSYSDEPLPIELCSDLPCIASPEEVAELIKAGYRSVLRTVLVKEMAGNTTQGITSMRDIPMVQLASDESGCAMCKGGECLLWKSGLTPIMGKLHLIKGKKMPPRMLKLLIHLTIMQWSDPSNVSIVRFCFQNMKKNTFDNPAN